MASTPFTTPPSSVCILRLSAIGDVCHVLPIVRTLQRAWPEAVGAAFAGQTEPVAERAGTVTVACTSAVWAQELDLLSERVVERLNERLGRPAVRGLRPQARPGR